MQELAILLLLFSGCSCEVLVMPLRDSITIPTPTDPELDESTALTFGIVPDTTEFVATWTTPSEDSFTMDDISSTEALRRKYLTQNGPINSIFPHGTILTVMRLSYLDSGNYTCSVLFTGGPNAGTTASAEIELSLLVQLESASSAVSLDVGATPSLTCEMKSYIHPDSDFQWRRGDDIITSNEKYRITYSNGSSNAARNGGRDLVSSRFSTLMVMDLEEADVGEYTCFVRGTQEALNIQLQREQIASTMVPHRSTTVVSVADETEEDLPTTNMAATQDPNASTAIVAGVVASVAVLLLLLGVAVGIGVCVAVHLRKPAAPINHDLAPGVEGAIDSHFIMTPSTVYGVSKPPQLLDVMTQNIAYSAIVLTDKRSSGDDYEIVD